MHQYDLYKMRSYNKKNAISHDVNSDMFKYSVNITMQIAKKIRERSGDIPIYLFNASGGNSEEVMSICSAGNFICLDIMDKYIKQLDNDGANIRVPGDGHWNFEGNKLIGNKLVEYFKSKEGIIPAME